VKHVVKVHLEIENGFVKQDIEDSIFVIQELMEKRYPGIGTNTRETVIREDGETVLSLTWELPEETQ
jgi:hypothetical protein